MRIKPLSLSDEPLKAARAWLKSYYERQPLSLSTGPIGDIERELLEEGLGQVAELQNGFIYLAANPAIDCVYKIGFTRKDVPERMRSLRSAGVLSELVPIQAWAVPDAPAWEHYVHRACAAWRVEREFFQAPWQVLQLRIEETLKVLGQQHQLAHVNLGLDAQITIRALY